MQTLQELAAVITRLHSAKTPLFVAIDGRAGSGKSTLAKNLAEKLGNTTIIHMDDFGYPVERDRLLEQVILPLTQQKQTQYQRYEWQTKSLAEWIPITPQGIFLFEGVRSLDSQLYPHYDYTIWIEYPAQLGFERGLARDKREYGVDSTYEWKNIWMPHEKHYIASQHPQKKAHIILDGLAPLV